MIHHQQPPHQHLAAGREPTMWKTLSEYTTSSFPLHPSSWDFIMYQEIPPSFLRYSSLPGIYGLHPLHTHTVSNFSHFLGQVLYICCLSVCLPSSSTVIHDVLALTCFITSIKIHQNHFVLQFALEAAKEKHSKILERGVQSSVVVCLRSGGALRCIFKFLLGSPGRRLMWALRQWGVLSTQRARWKCGEGGMRRKVLMDTDRITEVLVM